MKDLLIVLLFVVMLSSGSIFATTYFNRRYEEVLPITCVGIIVISFLLGMVKLLKFSPLLIVFICIALYVLSIIKIIKLKNIKQVLKNTFTPGFFCFLILVFIFFVAIHNKVLDTNDEFSHWGDIVKIMTIIDDFGTNHLSHSIFKSYPPAMSLFQYVFVEIYDFITGTSFSEWICYFTYNILSVIFLLPFTSKFEYKKFLLPLTFIFSMIAVPFTFYSYSYISLYIDAFLSYLTAAGFLHLLFNKSNGILFDLNIYSILFMLPMSKDAGLSFAIFILIGYVLAKMFEINKVQIKNKLVKISIAISSVLIPKLLWSLNIKLNDVKVSFSQKVDVKNLIQVLIGVDQSYRRKVFKNFVEYFVDGGLYIGNTEILINYACLLTITIVLLCLIAKLVVKHDLCSKKLSYSITAVFILSAIIYIFGLCVMYMYKFSEEEALALASFYRYIRIDYLGLWLYIIIGLLIVINFNKTNEYLYCGALICLMVLCNDIDAIVNFVPGIYAKASISLRENYNEFANKIMDNIGSDFNRVYFINQGETGEDALTYNFLIRPNYIDGENSFDENEETAETNSENWKNELLNEKYDYVVLYNLDDYFISNYSLVFKNKDDIKEKAIYKVDKVTGMLSLCE